MRKLLSFAFLLLISSVIHAQTHTVTVKVQHPGLINDNLVNDSICFNYEHDDEEDSLIATPLDGYDFLRWTENDTLVSNSSIISIVVHDDRTFFADFRLQSPEIGPLAPICSGESLELNAPTVIDIFDTVFWQISASESFTEFESYDGQPLDISFNHWWLRFCASNLTDIVYSNAVAIVINELKPTLYGDNLVCSNEEVEYHVEGVENAVVQWMISDSTLYGTGNPFNVIWSTDSGVKQLSVFITDTVTWCTTSLDMEVTVMTHVETAEQLVERKKNGVTYLLVYPNPNTLLYKYQWYHNDSLISCNKQYLYKPVADGGLAPGSYKVFVSFNEDENGNLICGAFSPEILVSRPDKTNQLSIFPNPSHSQGEIMVINEDMKASVLCVYSIDGRLMHQQVISDYQSTITLDLPKGVYTVQLKNDLNTKTGRIVIE